MASTYDPTRERWDKGIEFVGHLFDCLPNATQVRLVSAAREAYIYWQNNESPKSVVPVGWVGGQVRNELSPLVDILLDESPLLIDPTGQVGALYYDEIKEELG